MPTKRRTAADDLRALAGGGIEALRAAERLVGADEQIQIRVSAARKKLYREAARKAGAKNLSAWLISLADAAVK